MDLLKRQVSKDWQSSERGPVVVDTALRCCLRTDRPRQPAPRPHVDLSADYVSVARVGTVLSAIAVYGWGCVSVDQDTAALFTDRALTTVQEIW